MGLSLDFFYMELIKHKLQGNYIKNMGMKVYDKYGLDVAIFVSLDYRHTCLVKKYYADWVVVEA